MQSEFSTKKAVSEFMRDNGVPNPATRREFGEQALLGNIRYWSNGNTRYGLTHDGDKFVIIF